MRKFLGVLLVILGIGALVFGFMGLATNNLILQAAEVLSGIVMVWAGVVMFRSESVTVDQIDVYRDDNYPVGRG